MKTILVSAYHGWVFRNLLGSSALQRVHDQTGAQIIVCVPPDKVVFTQQVYGAQWLKVVSFDASSIIAARANKFWYRLGFLIQNSQYARDQRLERCVRTGGIIARLNYLMVNTFAAIVSKFSASVYLYRALDNVFSPAHFIDTLLDAHKPDLVLIGDIFGETDILFMRNARTRRIAMIGMVRSWDNTTTKGILRMVPDAIIANSATIKHELEVFHYIAPKLVAVVGLPQFDTWISGPTVSRDDFFTALGVDSNRRMILFAPAGQVLSDTDWQICQLLKDAIAQGKLPDDIVILVRNHPQHPADFSRFIPNEHFVIELPGTRTTAADYKGATLNLHENDHLRNSVYYSEIVIYVATSIGLDATVYDKPQIIVSFDGWETRSIVQSVQRHNREDCLQSMVASGGTRVAETIDELLDAMNAYLKDPSIDHAGRSQAIQDHMHILDGKAGERISRIVVDYINQS